MFGVNKGCGWMYGCCFPRAITVILEGANRFQKIQEPVSPRAHVPTQQSFRCIQGAWQLLPDLRNIPKTRHDIFKESSGCCETAKSFQLRDQTIQNPHVTAMPWRLQSCDPYCHCCPTPQQATVSFGRLWGTIWTNHPRNRPSKETGWGPALSSFLTHGIFNGFSMDMFQDTKWKRVAGVRSLAGCSTPCSFWSEATLEQKKRIWFFEIWLG